MYRRANYKWTINECLRLEREYDLLELSIQDIALLHERSPEAIMYKLDNEGIADYNDAFLNRYLNEEEEEEDEEEEEEKKNEIVMKNDIAYQELIDHSFSCVVFSLSLLLSFSLVSCFSYFSVTSFFT